MKLNLGNQIRINRRRMDLTQEQLAAKLGISAQSVSKWETEVTMPDISMLPLLSNELGVTIDELLSGEEVLAIAEDDQKQKESHFRDLVFGLLDLSTGIFFFAPFFRQIVEGQIQAAPLLSITQLQPWLKGSYLAVVLVTILSGILILTLQNCTNAIWRRHKSSLSLLGNVIGVVLFIFSHQPYAAGLTFVFLSIKALILIKKQ